MQTRTQRRFYPSTDLREYRTRRGLTLFEVALAAGLTPHRVSIIERFPDRAHPDEIESLKQAANDLSASAQR